MLQQEKRNILLRQLEEATRITTYLHSQLKRCDTHTLTIFVVFFMAVPDIYFTVSYLQPVSQFSDGVVQQQPRLPSFQSGLSGVQPRLSQLHQLQWHLRSPPVWPSRRGGRAVRPSPALPAGPRGGIQRLFHVLSWPLESEQNQTLPRHPAVSSLPLVPLLTFLPVTTQLSHGHTLPLCPSGLPPHPDDGGIHGAGGPWPVRGVESTVTNPVTHHHVEQRGHGQPHCCASTG